MTRSASYSLIDFGAGRKLERFGEFVLDRPAPLARGSKALLGDWDEADTRFDRSSKGHQGIWSDRVDLPACWTVEWENRFQLELKRNAHGHIGVFPEQAENWSWLFDHLRRSPKPLRVLNLFAYTGGATMAAAAAGAQVTHVDAAANVVRWARSNARLSGLDESPIRWIAEDATTYVRRELRRGRRYDVVIMDPPAYGHGGKGKVWQLERDLPALLQSCMELTDNAPKLFLLTCHVTDWGPFELSRFLRRNLDRPRHSGWNVVQLALSTEDGRSLDAGLAARWSSLE